MRVGEPRRDAQRACECVGVGERAAEALSLIRALQQGAKGGSPGITVKARAMGRRNIFAWRDLATLPPAQRDPPAQAGRGGFVEEAGQRVEHVRAWYFPPAWRTISRTQNPLRTDRDRPYAWRLMNSTPGWLTAQLIVSVATIVLVIHITLITVAYMIYFERKISAYIQDRIGPNRVGFDFGLPFLKFLRGCLGLGQPLADGIKFLVKEDYVPNRVDKVLFTLAPVIIIIPALIGFAVIPWGGVWNCPTFTIPVLGWVVEGGPVHVAGAHIGVGFVYLLAVASLGVYGVTLGGYASNNKFSFLGGLRATAQMISYEIPMGLALLAVLLAIGTVMPDGIIRYQADNGWIVFTQPLACVLFFIAILAEANRAPFDNAEAEQELVGGYHTEYSSMRFALFFLAEYAHMITSSAFLVLLFFGGYSLSPFPFIPDLPLLSADDTTLLAAVAKLVVFFTKVVLVICFMMFIRWTIPRLRYDQIMVGGWQMLIPTGMALVVAISVLVYLGQTGPFATLIANVVVVGLALAAVPFFTSGTANRKIPIYGSRFSPMPGEQVVTRPTDRVALEDRPERGTNPA